MPVVYFSASWDIGEVKDCELQPPNDSDVLSKVLLCDIADYTVDTTLVSKDPELFKEDAARLRAAYDNRKTFAVTFKGKGRQFEKGVV